MTLMATQRAVIPPSVPAKSVPALPLWLLWTLISIAGAVVGAVVAWRTRLLIVGGSDLLGQALRYTATIANAIIFSGAQWVLLRRYRLDVYWWIPATVAAGLVAGILVIPAVLSVFAVPAGVVPSVGTAILSSGLALGASGAITGAAQTLVLRPSAGNMALAWIPATIIGSALAGAATASISEQLFLMTWPAALSLSLLAAVGALLVAVSQAPVLLRVLR